MRKGILYLAASAFLTVGMTACSDDDDKIVENPDYPTVSNGVYILTQGSYYSGIEGGLNVLDYSTNTLSANVFKNSNNGQSLGATPQCGVAYGGKIYVGAYESNTIQIIDRYTYKSVKQISLANSTNGQQPRSMVATGGKVYISMYDGKVARLDTLSQSIDASVTVGPNPEVMDLHNGKLYVPNSDGMNYLNNYADGTTVSVVTLNPFSVEKTVTVPLNPTKCLTAGNDVYVLSMGNYSDVPSIISKIETDGTTTKVADATMAASAGQEIYIVNAPYSTGTISYSRYNVQSKQSTAMTFSEVEYPSGISVDPMTGAITVSSYVMNGGYPGYSLNGYVCQYTSTGQFVKKYDIGVGPAVFFYNTK